MHYANVDEIEIFISNDDYNDIDILCTYVCIYMIFW